MLGTNRRVRQQALPPMAGEGFSDMMVAQAPGASQPWQNATPHSGAGRLVPGLFGRGMRSNPTPSALPPMPGVISGYGGGTFNADGSQATPVDPVQADPRAPLGGSMRQGFDYNAAMQAMAGDKPKQSGWQIAAAIIGDALAASGGAQPWAVRSLVGQKQGYQDRLARAQQTLAGWQYRDYARQNEADLSAAAPFTIGRDRLQYDPATGQTATLYDGQDDAEAYASQLGLEPGSEPYFRAIEDYVLRSNGPSAFERDQQLDDYRTANDAEMEALRFGNRRQLEGIRQTNRLGVLAARPQAAPRGGSGRGSGGGDDLPVVSTPAEASRLPSGTRFRTPDGRVKVRP